MAFGAQVIVTRNERDFKGSPVPAMTPGLGITDNLPQHNTRQNSHFRNPTIHSLSGLSRRGPSKRAPQIDDFSASDSK